MTKSLEALIADMKAAAEKATPGEWRRTSTQFNGITATPFTLGGIEKVLAHTVEKSDAEFITQANPTNVLALIAALVQAQKSNSFLKEQLAQLANFNPDWDKLEACQESWREVSTELKSAQSHIAELESLCVNHDAAMRGVEPLCVKLPDYRNSPDMHTKQYYEAIGFNQGLDAAAESIRTAGGTVEGDER